MITISQGKLTELLLKCKNEKKERICPNCQRTTDDIVCNCGTVRDDFG